MAADGAPDQTLVRQAVEPAVAAIAGSGGEDQGEVARFPCLTEALLDSDQQFVGGADADEAGDGNGIAGPDDGGGFGRGDDLVFHDPSCSERNAATPGANSFCDFPPTNTPTWPPGRPSSR